jgi:hypothetical protein
MSPIKNVLVAAALSATVSVAPFASAHAADQIMKPVQGVSFHAGTKHAAAYYLKDNRTCKLVFTLADDANFAPNRVETAIETGKSSLQQLAEGKALEFACQDNANSMTVKSQETIAAK